MKLTDEDGVVDERCAFMTLFATESRAASDAVTQ